ncbi:hypothetical protein JOF41_003603 [Saccharothrix coeruleofusca]|uniref:hypothetical protein n=1 Tax=Saccharothrix coeruleofusca TaxID=33919 RepID=UPI001AE3ECAE|nr:hypothetical protein [Saccharothrix coeruleofusca]MBP2337425.1 hypothetical protein [Saccharothrix coeruleofusca]
MSPREDHESTGAQPSATVVPAQSTTDDWIGSAQARRDARMAAGFTALEQLGPRPPADLMQQVREDLHGRSAPRVAG